MFPRNDGFVIFCGDPSGAEQYTVQKNYSYLLPLLFRFVFQVSEVDVFDGVKRTAGSQNQLS